MFLGVGSKVWAIVGTVLVAGLIMFSTIQYIQKAEKDKVIIELQEKQQQRRGRIDEAIRTAPNDVSNSLQYLRDRQGSK